MSSVYAINRGIDKPVVFRGLKAQYIWYLGIGIALLLLLFALLNIAGAALLFCIPLVLLLGLLLFYYVYHLNHRFGEHGWMKAMAKRSVPTFLFCDQLFCK